MRDDEIVEFDDFESVAHQFPTLSEGIILNGHVLVLRFNNEMNFYR